ncbi:MAG: protein kinase [Myxococcales bacterium]|nr:protein kinase [Myxococcales bacterium]
MGEVFLARAPGVQRPVVIKRILSTMVPDGEVLRGFLDETRIAARLRHPHIIRIDELGEVEGEWYIRMEYVEGASLSQVMKTAAKAGEYLGLGVCLYVTGCIASALEHAHQARDPEGRPLHVVHRDVTPHNVLLGRSGAVKLIDFGVARAEQRFQFTSPGLVKGKLAYMSPEQADGKKVDGRTDLFALGICLWEILTGRRLFRGETVPETLQRLIALQIAPPSMYRADVPPEVDALVLKALSREPEGRFQRAADFVEAIDTVCDQYELTQGARHLSALIRRLIPEAGHAEGLAPDEEPTAQLEASDARSEVTRHDRRRPPPPQQPDTRETRAPEGSEPDADALTEFRAPVVEEGSLIGRAGELADLHQMLGAGDRLVTLLGPGGVGKSRLAREAARQQAANYSGRVFFADATAARDVEGLCLTVAEALGAALPPGGNPIEGVSALLASRRRCLVVLDNVEHLQNEAGEALSAWLLASRGGRFLVGSRVALEVAEEKTYEVAPLRLDGGDEAESDAATLFLERATQANPRFPGGKWAREAVRELVRRLDGMPLAIELAAAQMADAPLEALREQLHDTSEGSRGSLRGVDEAFAASWDMLSDAERAALAQCTVFAAGFTAEAAVRVLRVPGRQGVHAEGVLQALHKLRSKSLLRISYAATSDSPRYVMYESLRARVMGRLPEEEEKARRRHAEWFLRFGETLGEEAEKGGGVLDVLATERENLVAAWRWWLSQGKEGARNALRVLLALDAFFVVRGPYGGQRTMLDTTLGQLDSPEDRAPGLEARARVLLARGRPAEAAADLDAVLATVSDPATQARALAYLGSVRKQVGSLVEAQVLFERALRDLRKVRDERMQGRVLANLGAIAMEKGRMDDAQDLYSAALELHKKSGDRRFEGVTFSNLATMQQMRGAWKEAEDSLSRALAIHRELGNRRSEGMALTNLGDLERDRGAGARAIALYRRAVLVNQEVGNRRFEGICLLNHALLLLEQRDVEAGGELLEEALSLFLAVGDKRHAGLAYGARGALRAWAKRPGAAEDIDAAHATLGAGGDVAFRASVDVYAAQLDLSKALALDQQGNEALATKARAAATARIDTAVAAEPGGSRAERFEHVRMGLRVLKAWSTPLAAG